MGLLSASNLTKSFGTEVIFSGASFEIQENDRIGLVGVNGSGKTTLFKILTGEYAPDNGEIYKANHCVLGYMAVSYTHLDVYKRQLPARRAVCLLRAPGSPAQKILLVPKSRP